MRNGLTKLHTKVVSFNLLLMANYQSIDSGTGQSQVRTQDQPTPPNLNYLDVFKGSITLENKGSVARDHLANERTFLAWLRTSLSFVTIGIGITQLFKLQKNSKVNVSDRIVNLNVPESNNFTHYGKPLGAIFISLGILTLIYGWIRFFEVQHLLTYNHFPSTRKGLTGLITIILAISLATLVIVTKSY